ncbi:hypothetical protein [Nitrosopumilus sp.]|uniref:hypothetical protein n=1 Tax=Nitrosopumilus sp. TaxID=2024843 RepID=UPI00247D7E76|nr:hypothetical protein [Nitrosopumilus sp.]MCV0430708.1 hypothetical protein [Nitrosopumilus sp.]
MNKSSYRIKVKPFLWEKQLLLSLDSKWVDVFGSIPSFDVEVKEGKLVLVGPKLRSRGGKNG